MSKALMEKKKATATTAPNWYNSVCWRAAFGTALVERSKQCSDDLKAVSQPPVGTACNKVRGEGRGDTYAFVRRWLAVCHFFMDELFNSYQFVPNEESAAS